MCAVVVFGRWAAAFSQPTSCLKSCVNLHGFSFPYLSRQAVRHSSILPAHVHVSRIELEVGGMN